MKNKPILSIIVPIYNTEKYLDRCITTILNQTLKNIELILINDGSTDSSLKIIKKYEKIDNRIKIIDQLNVGLSSTRNKGIKIAKGKYIAFVDSDDYIDNKKAYELMVKIAEQKKSEIVIGNYLFVNEKNQLWPRYDKNIFTNPLNFKKNSFLKNKKIFYDSLSQGVWNKIYKRTFITQNNLKFPDGLIFEDTPFSLEVVSLSKKISILPINVYNYYIGRQESLSRKKGIKQLDFLKTAELSKNVAKKYKIYEKYFPYFIWLVLPVHQLDIIENKYRKLFFNTLKENITKEDFTLVLKYGNENDIKFLKLVKSKNYFEYNLIEQTKRIKINIKNIFKRILCKINPNYRILSKIYDLNSTMSSNLYYLLDKENRIEELIKYYIKHKYN